MKNLANCTPREFLRQTNRIRKKAADWLKLTDIMNIRRRLPKAEDAGEASPEVRDAMLRKQASDNLRAVLDAVLEEHPDETLDLIALMCFIEPEDIDNYRVSDLLGAVTELINCPEVLDFFTSLARLGQTNFLSTVTG